MFKKTVLGAFVLGLSGAASASLVYDSSIQLSAQGFGNAPRALTIQETGQGNGVESGCIAVGAGGTLTGGSGSCIADASVFAPNGVTNIGGDEVNPLSDNQKFGIPTIGSLGITNAGQIGILFNAVEPGGNSVTVDDLTLKIFNGTNLVAAIDGQQTFDETNPGNGVAGFVFVVDLVQQAFLNTAVFGQSNFGDFRFALEASISGFAGGPESFAIVNLGGGNGGGGTVPEPASLALVGLGALAAAGVRRRKR